ncbi:ERCC4-type nuclease [Sporomusaceae bacterium BoRhaA]|uniref:ERCC4 domain-containing protein n=1 Tax=Pelorhabdus rhamnosifermentans TaxID=2772457 RepID=UPI001C05FBEA|nr:ERCC4 domain-containing protein [Pelorhabdus rhamnosifermentans]MBU2701164.1 ERCC4-type nuclease [Pelorhabdus rhamnosifermentans]
MRYHYTETELKSLLSSITIIIDTRENQNQHITDYLDKHKVPHISRKLDYGDYTAMLPVNSDLGIMRDTYFTDTIAIERKNSLDELANNLTADRLRFESELIRSHGCRMLLMIESGGYDDIIKHNYRSKYEPKSYIATLSTYTARYGLNINFIPAAYAGNFILFNLLYHCREYLKNNC